MMLCDIRIHPGGMPASSRRGLGRGAGLLLVIVRPVLLVLGPELRDLWANSVDL